MPKDMVSVIISRRGADRIRAGHVWVYRSDVIDASGISPGAMVTVAEEHRRGGPATSAPDQNVRATRPLRTLGTALYSSASQIALRMISSKPVSDFDQLVRQRIREAVAYRQRFVQNTNAYRLIFSEGDFLPGLIVDRYNDILSLQVLTQAMDAASLREVFLSELQSALQPAAIIERVDPRVRKLEQLPEKESGVIWKDPLAPGAQATLEASSSEQVGPDALVRAGELGSPIAAPTAVRRVRAPAPTRAEVGPELRGAEPHPQVTTEFQMNGVRFVYDALGGQKTGAFLDQRENYAASAQYARGEALDVFCYQGGFALHLAKVCHKVTGVDSSRPALELADRNAALNGREIEWIEANAFDLLRDYSDSGKKYDCIVLDPPAFAKSRRDLPTALRGNKELNLRALKMLSHGGILVSCSCSYHVSASDFLDTLSSAALDSHRIIRLLENRGQSKDHPSVLGIPETAYLKCLIAAVS
jgi:23S rRNA (cytosine1962-C5)-methyltransferase